MALPSAFMWEGCPKALEERWVLQCVSPLLIQTFVGAFCALGALGASWSFSDHPVYPIFPSSFLTSIFHFLWSIPSPLNHLPILHTNSVSTSYITWHIKNTHTHTIHLSPGLFVFYFCLLDKWRATDLKSSVLIMLLPKSICSCQMECF